MTGRQRIESQRLQLLFVHRARQGGAAHAGGAPGAPASWPPCLAGACRHSSRPWALPPWLPPCRAACRLQPPWRRSWGAWAQPPWLRPGQGASSCRPEARRGAWAAARQARPSSAARALRPRPGLGGRPPHLRVRSRRAPAGRRWAAAGTWRQLGQGRPAVSGTGGTGAVCFSRRGGGGGVQGLLLLLLLLPEAAAGHPTAATDAPRERATPPACCPCTPADAAGKQRRRAGGRAGGGVPAATGHPLQRPAAQLSLLQEPPGCLRGRPRHAVHWAARRRRAALRRMLREAGRAPGRAPRPRAGPAAAVPRWAPPPPPCRGHLDAGPPWAHLVGVRSAVRLASVAMRAAGAPSSPPPCQLRRRAAALLRPVAPSGRGARASCSV
jgi:hypothetical protein